MSAATISSKGSRIGSPKLAGALHTRTGRVLWVGNGRKNSYLFLLLLRRLHEAFPHARKLHVVLDNYGIHSSQLVQRALTEEFGGRIVLHFLPPYSPQHNRIERLWRELHANVTRNHRCRTLPELLRSSIATRASSLVNRRAMASPIPDAAPVTSTRRLPSLTPAPRHGARGGSHRPPRRSAPATRPRGRGRT